MCYKLVHGVLLFWLDVWVTGMIRQNPGTAGTVWRYISQTHRMHTSATFEFLGGTNDVMETKIREAHHLVDHENVWKMTYCRYHLVQDFFQQYALDPISQIAFSKNHPILDCSGSLGLQDGLRWKIQGEICIQTPKIFPSFQNRKLSLI